jgi:hypothetical protein
MSESNSIIKKYIKNNNFIFFLHILSFAGFSLFFFNINSDALFSQQDGIRWQILASQEFFWGSAHLGISSQIFESLNNIRLPINFHLIPEFIIPSILSNSSKISTLAVMTLLSINMFCATYFITRVFGFRSVIALATSWTLLLLNAPFFKEGLIYPMFAIGPPFAWNITMTLYLIGFFWKIGTRKKFFFLEPLIFIFLFFWITLAVPGMVAIIYPILSLFVFTSLINANSREEFFFKIVTIVIVLLLAYVFGFIDFIVGLFLHTATSEFSKELVLPFPPHSLDQASILYHAKSFGYGGPILFSLAAIGCLFNIFSLEKSKRLLSRTLIICAITFAGVGGLVILYTSYNYISPVYYDYLITPFYVIFAIDILDKIISKFTKTSRLKMLMHSINFDYEKANFILIIILIILPWCLSPIIFDRKHTANYLRPPEKTPFIEKLQNDIGLSLNSSYRGRVFTAYKLDENSAQDWMQLSSAGDKIWTSIGNDLQFDGLWWYDIPTLFEYNWLLSPFFFKVTRDLMARQEDIQMRNFSTLRKINPKLLKLFGVKYIISDSKINFPANLVQKKEIISESKILYLYSYNRINLGNYSPTKFVGIGDAKSFINLINSDHNLEKVATVEKPPRQNLVAASYVKLFIEKNGNIKIIADSSGTSMIILPFEYSNCLNLKNNLSIKEDNFPQLIRVNFLLTGIVFKGHLNSNLRYFTGPFSNSKCRINDKKDFQKLNVDTSNLFQK